MKFLNLNIWIHKKLHWEYWHTRTIYFPLFWAWLFLSLKHRSLVFFSKSNPSIKHGGLVMCSKKSIYNLIPSKWIPKTLLFQPSDSLENIKKELEHNQLSFPLVIKPDIGLKGLGVDFVNTLKELQEKKLVFKEAFLLQEKISFTNEVGIFYVRFPNSDKGNCTGMVRKDFLKVIGNGKATLRELILDDSRAFVHYKKLFNQWNEQLDDVVKNQKEILLVPFGSHTRGATFYDETDSLTPELCKAIDQICRQIDGFYYGRLDIMYKDWNSLLDGKDFSIIEINGAAAEPTHIYDPKHSYFFAAKTIIKHWSLMSKISWINRKQPTPYSFIHTLKAIRENLQLERKLRKLYL